MTMQTKVTDSIYIALIYVNGIHFTPKQRFEINK